MRKIKNSSVAHIKKIKITECKASGFNFANLTPGSEHETIKAPEGYEKHYPGVWVMGNVGHVLVLHAEFEVIERDSNGK